MTASITDGRRDSRTKRKERETGRWGTGRWPSGRRRPICKCRPSSDFPVLNLPVSLVCLSLHHRTRPGSAVQVDEFEEGRNAGSQEMNEQAHPRIGLCLPGLLPSCIPDFISLSNIRTSERAPGNRKYESNDSTSSASVMIISSRGAKRQMSGQFAGKWGGCDSTRPRAAVRANSAAARHDGRRRASARAFPRRAWERDKSVGTRSLVATPPNELMRWAGPGSVFQPAVAGRVAP